jgi:hypothetical protein
MYFEFLRLIPRLLVTLAKLLVYGTRNVVWTYVCYKGISRVLSLAIGRNTLPAVRLIARIDFFKTRFQCNLLFCEFMKWDT